jgi:hypothetical protein
MWRPQGKLTLSDKPLSLSIDIAALAKAAGIPSDEPAIQAFAKLIATECIGQQRGATRPVESMDAETPLRRCH